VPVEKPGHPGVWCSECGYEFSPELQGKPCPRCGNTSRTYSAVSSTTATGTASSSRTVGIHHSTTAMGRPVVKGKARSGEAGKPGGKPWLETKSELSWSHDRQKWLQRQKTENRRDNRYTEVVKDPDTGEIVHESDEPLTDHQGHGSARRKKPPPASE
jgi:rubredoxin